MKEHSSILDIETDHKLLPYVYNFLSESLIDVPEDSGLSEEKVKVLSFNDCVTFKQDDRCETDPVLKQMVHASRFVGRVFFEKKRKNERYCATCVLVGPRTVVTSQKAYPTSEDTDYDIYAVFSIYGNPYTSHRYLLKKCERDFNDYLHPDANLLFFELQETEVQSPVQVSSEQFPKIPNEPVAEDSNLFLIGYPAFMDEERPSYIKPDIDLKVFQRAMKYHDTKTLIRSEDLTSSSQVKGDSTLFSIDHRGLNRMTGTCGFGVFQPSDDLSQHVTCCGVVLYDNVFKKVGRPKRGICAVQPHDDSKLSLIEGVVPDRYTTMSDSKNNQGMMKLVDLIRFAQCLRDYIRTRASEVATRIEPVLHQYVNQMQEFQQLNFYFLGVRGTGKSTLINSILGQNLLPSNGLGGDCTRAHVNIENSDIPGYEVLVYFQDVNGWKEAMAMGIDLSSSGPFLLQRFDDVSQVRGFLIKLMKLPQSVIGTVTVRARFTQIPYDVTLIDVPGLDGTENANSELLSSVNEKDHYFLVYSGERAVNNAAVEQIKKEMASLGLNKPYTVITKVDVFEPQDIEDNHPNLVGDTDEVTHSNYLNFISGKLNQQRDKIFFTGKNFNRGIEEIRQFIVSRREQYYSFLKEFQKRLEAALKQLSNETERRRVYDAITYHLQTPLPDISIAGRVPHETLSMEISSRFHYLYSENYQTLQATLRRDGSFYKNLRTELAVVIRSVLQPVLDDYSNQLSQWQHVIDEKLSLLGLINGTSITTSFRNNELQLLQQSVLNQIVYGALFNLVEEGKGHRDRMASNIIALFKHYAQRIVQEYEIRLRQQNHQLLEVLTRNVDVLLSSANILTISETQEILDLTQEYAISSLPLSNLSISEDGENNRNDQSYLVDRELRLDNLQRHQVPRDGNCMFHAILYGLRQLNNLRDLPTDHLVLREDIVKEIPKLKIDEDVLRVLHSVDTEEYLKRMRQEGEWGDHFELQAAANRFKVNIHVHSHLGNEIIRPMSSPSSSSSSDQETTVGTIHLAYDGNHFDGVGVRDTQRHQP